jgi:hypothetical protein
MLTAQLAPGPSDDPHVLLAIAKSLPAFPLITMLEMLTPAVLLTFFRVAVCEALVVPTLTVPKLRAVGSRLTIVPVPVSCAVNVPTPVTTVSCPARVPGDVGVNVRPIEQLAPPPNVDPQLVTGAGAIPNSADALKLPMLIDVVPVFLSVAKTGALVVFRVCVVAKLISDGVNVADPILPVPVNAIT